MNKADIQDCISRSRANSVVVDKHAEQEAMSAQVAAYLAKGGRITQLKHGEVAHDFRCVKMPHPGKNTKGVEFERTERRYANPKVGKFMAFGRGITNKGGKKSPRSQQQAANLLRSKLA